MNTNEVMNGVGKTTESFTVVLTDAYAIELIKLFAAYPELKLSEVRKKIRRDKLLLALAHLEKIALSMELSARRDLGMTKKMDYKFFEKGVTDWVHTLRKGNFEIVEVRNDFAIITLHAAEVPRGY